MSCMCRELAETILDSGDTLLTILGDILDFSKIDHNSMVLESAPVSLTIPLNFIHLQRPSTHLIIA